MEMLKKLEELDRALKEYLGISDYLENGLMDEFREKNNALIEPLGSLPGTPSVVDALPIFPPSDTAYLKAKKETENAKKHRLIALGVVALGIVVGLLLKAIQLGSACIVLGGIAAFWLNNSYKDTKKSFEKKEKEYKQALEESQNAIAKFRRALASYESEVKAGFVKAKQYKQQYQETFEKQEQLLAEYTTKQEIGEQMKKEKMDEIFTHDYIDVAYLGHVPTMIKLLKSGRADSYKEALNMAIELERQEKIEEARQQEEARKLAAIERQAEETRRHNMEMERQQAAHDRAMENAAKEQAEAQRRAAIQADKDRRRAEHEAAIRANEDRRQAEREAQKTRMAGVSKCANCRNSNRCPSNIKNSGAGLTCGGYQPY